MRKVMIAVLITLVAGALAAPAPASAGRAGKQREREFVVLYGEGASVEAGRAAIARAGGRVVRENRAIGLATVRTTRSDFAAAAQREVAIAGVAPNRSIGAVPSGAEAKRKRSNDVERLGRTKRAGTRPDVKRAVRAEPLAALQWDMRQIDATPNRSYAVERGERRVRVGIMDTGIDGSHPDIAPNFDRGLSRNFTVDIPGDARGNEIDGPCAAEPDKSCTDPAWVDENEHGTHVASTVGSPLNGLGIGGVAPNVTLVNVRAGQDSGFFFLQPTVDALTYSADIRLDVVNMSFYVDPWLFNCLNNPADAPADQAEQRTIIAAVRRALGYAYRHGVTLVAAAGNEETDYTKPSIDPTSPDFADEPGEAPYDRRIDPKTCWNLPAEGRHVVTVAATGPSTRKAFYSNFGRGYIDVAAPGGDYFDNPSSTLDLARGILGAYPKAIAQARGELKPDGTPAVPRVVRDCKGGTCAYYQYLIGTSMASPHAAGVAALIVSRYGDGRLDPDVTARRLLRSAGHHACPRPRTYTYTLKLPQEDGSIRVVKIKATCEGRPGRNGFYGGGIVNALRAVRGDR